jgi:hypothetical protein
MLIKKRKYEKCSKCKANIRLINEDVYGCDYCKNPIDLNMDGSNYLDFTAFWHDDRNERMQFCSWICALEKLKTLKTDYFINLPFLSFDEKKVGLRAKDFWEAIKKIKLP